MKESQRIVSRRAAHLCLVFGYKLSFCKNMIPDGVEQLLFTRARLNLDGTIQRRQGRR